MKRALLIFGLILVGLASRGHAQGDQWGSERPAVWRSSRTSVPENFVLIATGPIHLHAICVESATVNIESYLTLFNASATAQATFNPSVSTAVYLTTNLDGSRNGAMPQTIEFDMYFATGVVINKVGGAFVNLLWDFNNPSTRKHDPVIPYTP